MIKKNFLQKNQHID